MLNNINRNKWEGPVGYGYGNLEYQLHIYQTLYQNCLLKLENTECDIDDNILIKLEELQSKIHKISLEIDKIEDDKIALKSELDNYNNYISKCISDIVRIENKGKKSQEVSQLLIDLKLQLANYYVRLGKIKDRLELLENKS